MADAQWFYSQSYPWSASGTIPVLPSFLEGARKMKAPDIECFFIRANLTVSTGASGGPMKTFWQQFTKVEVNDVGGPRYNVRGSSLRVINQYEYGEGFTDGVNLGNNLVGQSVDAYIRVPFNVMKARMRSDFKLPLVEFLDGGAFNLYLAAASFGAAATWTITAGTYQVFARVVEDRQREAKSRLVWRDYSMTQVEATYPVSGSLRAAIVYTGETNEGAGTKLPAQNYTSASLDGLTQLPSSLLVDDYKMESKPRVNKDAAGTVPASEDVFAEGYAHPVFNARADQKLPQLPDMTLVHLKTDGAVPANNPQVIISSITDRSEEGVRRTLKGRSVAETAQGLASFGKVVDAQGRKKPLGKWNADIARRMPLKLEIPRK